LAESSKGKKTIHPYESSGIKDLVTGGAGAVNGELVGDLLGSLLLNRKERNNKRVR
jgi:hypothetical protein